MEIRPYDKETSPFDMEMRPYDMETSPYEMETRLYDMEKSLYAFKTRRDLIFRLPLTPYYMLHAPCSML
jgi:hypothetical protein